MLDVRGSRLGSGWEAGGHWQLAHRWQWQPSLPAARVASAGTAAGRPTFIFSASLLGGRVGSLHRSNHADTCTSA